MDLFPHPRFGTEYKIGRQVALAPTRNTEPAPDNRYPAFAAQMQDGRLVTDYRNHCSRNVPAGAQFTTKKWMIQQAITNTRDKARKYYLSKNKATVDKLYEDYKQKVGSINNKRSQLEQWLKRND